MLEHVIEIWKKIKDLNSGEFKPFQHEFCYLHYITRHHWCRPLYWLMVAWHLQLACFAMLASCHLFSVQPEISPCTPLLNWVLSQYVLLHLKKKKRKDPTIRQTFKTKAIGNQLKNQTFQHKKTVWKINPIDKKIAPLWGDRLSL